MVENFGGHFVGVRTPNAEQIRIESAPYRIVLVVVDDRGLPPDALQPQVLKELNYFQSGPHSATSD